MTASESAAPRGLERIDVLLAVQSLVVVLVSINRLSRLTLGYVAPNEFLRWVDVAKRWARATPRGSASTPSSAAPASSPTSPSSAWASISTSFALLALVAFVLLRRLGRQPLLVYYATAYGLGLVATGWYKALR